MPASVAGIFNIWLDFCLVGDLRARSRNFSEPVNSFHPVFAERRIDNTVMTRSVIETIRIGNNANVCEATEKHQRAKLVLVFR